MKFSPDVLCEVPEVPVKSDLQDSKPIPVKQLTKLQAYLGSQRVSNSGPRGARESRFFPELVQTTTYFVLRCFPLDFFKH